MLKFIVNLEILFFIFFSAQADFSKIQALLK